jgi:signal transduction histidine kinase
MSDTTTMRQVLIGSGFLVAYVALDYISYVKPYRELGITPWNPPPGLSIALIFLEGVRMAPFVLVAPLLADLFVRHVPLGFPLNVLAALLVGGVYVAAGVSLQRFTNFDPRFRAVRDAFVLIVVAVVTALLSAVLFVGALLSGGLLLRDEVGAVLWRSAVGDVIGILTVVPIILLWRTWHPWPSLGLSALAQALAVLAALLIVFGYQNATAFQLFYLLFLPVLWVALSHGPPGSAVVLLLVQIGIVIGAEIRFGADPGFGVLQVLMIALAITGLILGTIVAEREDAAARLRDQQAALNRALRIRSAGEIAATIAHEMNQPLTALTTYSGIAAKAFKDGDNALAQRALGKVEAECQRAASVLTGIRELLRQGSLSKRPVEIGPTLGELDELLRLDLAKRGVALHFEIEDGLPVISADGVQLQQAVHNLIINGADAIESVGREGEVTVTVARSGSHNVRIEVADNGPGFPPGYDVTDPTPFTSSKADGSGIGIAVVRSIAEAHGGAFAIRSTSRGAAITLTLPINGGMT